MRRGSSTSRFTLYPGAKRRSRRSTGAGACMRRRTTTRAVLRPTTAPSFAPISISSMRRWRGSGWRRWATRSRWLRRSSIASRRRQCRTWTTAFPEDSPHLAKARLLANAGLNEYIPQEIAADPDSSSWSALGRSADLRLVWRNVSRHAGAEARTALCGVGVDQFDSAGLLAHSFPEPSGTRSRRSRRRTISIHIWWLR